MFNNLKNPLDKKISPQFLINQIDGISITNNQPVKLSNALLFIEKHIFSINNKKYNKISPLNT